MIPILCQLIFWRHYIHLISSILNQSGCIENRSHIFHAKISILGSTCHYMGAKPGSKPIDDLDFLTIVISVILVFLPFYK
jgi:hypothetical protein